MSFLFVIPMTSILFKASTPSIIESSWFTTLSCTPVPEFTVPLCLAIASNSSKIITDKGLYSPNYSSFFLALANNFLTFSSLYPWYLLIISGPLTTLTSKAFKTFPSCLATKVLPHPGGPNRRIPFTWDYPYFLRIAGLRRLAARALRKISSNS